ncbi:hypothetical protein ACWJPV_28060, partial [Klebsiella pneumoniae]
QNDVTLKMPAFEWVHVQLHQQKGMISLSPPTICNSAQIIDALNDAGLSGAARDAEKMKKGDAAEHAEFHMKDNRWVPGWMCTPRPQAETETTEYRDDQAEAA